MWLILLLTAGILMCGCGGSKDGEKTGDSTLVEDEKDTDQKDQENQEELKDEDDKQKESTGDGEEDKTDPEGETGEENQDVGEVEMWKFNFADYTGDAEGPNIYYWLGSLAPGKDYTISFDYYLEGENPDKLKFVNGQNAWLEGDESQSQIVFEDAVLKTGINHYSYRFNADLPYLVPAFQTDVAEGTPTVYVWNIKLMDEEAQFDMFERLTVDKLGHNMEGYEPISTVTMDPKELEGGQE